MAEMQRSFLYCLFNLALTLSIKQHCKAVVKSFLAYISLIVIYLIINTGRGLWRGWLREGDEPRVSGR